MDPVSLSTVVDVSECKPAFFFNVANIPECAPTPPIETAKTSERALKCQVNAAEIPEYQGPVDFENYEDRDVPLELSVLIKGGYQQSEVTERQKV